MVYDLIVIGGGAAGFYAAIQLAEARPGSRILIVEKSPKLLSKVRISGGGRCNVTHHCFDRFELAHHYPRGEKPLKELFRIHDAQAVIWWFASKNVKLKTEEDGRMFPVTDDSETIVRCFMEQAHHHAIRIELSKPVTRITKAGDDWEIACGDTAHFLAKNILIACGGSPSDNAYRFIADLGIRVVPPIPSLFTFNDSEKRFADLMGVAVPNGEVRIAGTKLTSKGPILITHWGLSGPGVIRLSAWAAETLHEKKYEFVALVSWVGSISEDQIRSYLQQYKQTNVRQKVWNHPLYGLPQRLWHRLCALADIPDSKVWGELSLKSQNRLMELMIRCPFNIKGKTTFKEEFVTCGGVDLKELNLESMESRQHKGIFFAGEVLNIDGETGGFNFQAAWTTGYIAATAIKKNLS